MKRNHASLLVLPLIIVGTLVAQNQSLVPNCSSPRFSPQASVEYVVSLAEPERQRAHVTVLLRDQKGRRILNLPVWNALYQVRNFSANVENVQAQDGNGNSATVVHTGTSEWQISAPEGCVAVRYDIHLDTPGPFGSRLNADHAFLKWPMVLMYLPDIRDKPVALRFADVPPGWEIRDLHLCSTTADVVCTARNYDELADSPAEAGIFQQASFGQDGATYRIVVDADPADYDMAAVQETLRKITHSAVDWMQDRPYDEYTFLYRFPKEPAGGGMEHAYGTAIDIGANRLRENPAALAEVSAHEFFHLWNVKRIRPESLEPIDYQHEQDTRALWFSEGITSTVADMLLVRAGINSEQQYQINLGRAITELQRRPAHTWQSVEESSLDAWLEGNSFYRSPERSISYYNKGEIVGVLLDLRLRELTGGRKSLRDLFQWMNDTYAKQHRFFEDSEAVLQAAEHVVSGQPPSQPSTGSLQSLTDFFRDYVRGVKEIPYDDFLQFVGLHVVSKSRDVATLGLTMTANIGAEPEVVAVQAGSDAQQQGIGKGDRIVAVNGKPATDLLEDGITQMRPGDTITLTVAHRKGQRDVRVRLGSRIEQWFELEDLTPITTEQLAHRKAWMHGDDEGTP